jgi:spermidine synthase
MSQAAVARSSSTPVESRFFFVFFFLSGLCSLLYEVIWLRLGMAQFGVTTPLVSIFLSIFLAGLGLGTWAGGKFAARLEARSSRFFVRAYGLTEFLIGASALLVPVELRWARQVLDSSGNGSGLGLGDSGYYFAAGLWLLAVLLPWCTCMGATFPLAMAAIRRWAGAESARSFSFLYLANVLGAILGALLPAFVLVELFGFQHSLLIGTCLNCAIFLTALGLSFSATDQAQYSPAQPDSPSVASGAETLSRGLILALLGLTGLTSLAMEVIWIRQFTPYLGNAVWSLALILCFYLAGTFAGSRYYRRWITRHVFSDSPLMWSVLGVAALLPCLTADPRINMEPLLRVAIGVAPFTAVLGFLTPMLVDRFCFGRPDLAGTAYGVNIVGCIVGPLLASFILLPRLGERWSLIVLALPLLGLALLFPPAKTRRASARSYAELALVALAFILLTKSFEDTITQKTVHRDYSATTVATGQGMEKELLVNGVGLTMLTPITKIMAHLPLAFLPRQPQNALDICVGMGVTYRSLSTWGIQTTAVELLPSVAESQPYYHHDFVQWQSGSDSHLVIDDGRLFLQRSRQQFDVITIDPPPPIEAVGSSLLYSKDFYAIIRKHLRPGGILQQWVPGSSDVRTVVSIVRALTQSFPHVRIFPPVTLWGIHILASDSPFSDFSAADLAQRTPPAAQRDLVEWGPYALPQQQYAALLSRELAPAKILALDTKVPALDDDHPVNEYSFLHRLRGDHPIRSFFNAFNNTTTRPIFRHSPAPAANK